jgi:caffeoyl-CoA O-methyltransferase
MTVERFVSLTPELHDYLVQHSSFRDGVTEEVERAARDLGEELAEMQIGGDQAALITLLVRAIDGRRALEVGTFLGYGAISIARGLPEDGELICCELDEGYAERARAHIERAGLSDRVEIRIGPAIETLRAISDQGSFDLAFIDADKQSYPAYYEECLRLVRSNGLILLDNVFMGDRILEQPDEPTRVVAELNDRIAADDRVEAAMLGIADGVTLARKR